MHGVNERTPKPRWIFNFTNIFDNLIHFAVVSYTCHLNQYQITIFLKLLFLYSQKKRKSNSVKKKSYKDAYPFSDMNSIKCLPKQYLQFIMKCRTKFARGFLFYTFLNLSSRMYDSCGRWIKLGDRCNGNLAREVSIQKPIALYWIPRQIFNGQKEDRLLK